MFPDPLFADRAEAGRELARRLAVKAPGDVVVYALPRGGVPVALEVARALKAPLDLLLVRKIGAPGQPELALAALVDGEPPQMVVNEDIRRATHADEAFLEQARLRETAELRRRRRLYLGDRPHPDPRGRTAIIVDDGLATGATARAAILGLRGLGVARVILAVPIAPPDTAAAMRDAVDELICLAQPEIFPGVGAFYRDFHQLSDAEVLDMLDQTSPPGRAG